MAHTRIAKAAGTPWVIEFRSFFSIFFPINNRSARGKERVMKFSATLATLLVALALAACGGGGGGQSSAPQPAPSTPTTADTTKPVLTLTTSSPASLTTTVVFSSNEDLGGNVSILVQNGNTVPAGTTRLNAGNRGITWTPSAALACNTVYTVTGTGTDLAGNTGTATGTVTTVGCQQASWPPPTVAPIGQKVIGMNVLPGTDVAIGDAAWQSAVRDGTVKFTDTGMIQTGVDTRPVVWAVMQYRGNWCFVPVHKDDGTASAGRTSPGTQCNTEEVDYFVGTDAGLLRHFPGRNQCFELFWDEVDGRNHDRQVACPQ